MKNIAIYTVIAVFVVAVITGMVYVSRRITNSLTPIVLYTHQSLG